MVNFTLASVVFLVQLQIVEKDNGKWNHMFHYRSNDQIDLLISYTGESSLGREGESFRVLLKDLTCSQVLEAGNLDNPGGAWICTAEKAER